MKLSTSVCLSVLGLGMALACGRSEEGEDDHGAGGTGGAGAAGGMGGTQATGWLACEQNSDCTLAAASCCGVCGEPKLGDVDAVNREHLDQHFQNVCPKPLPCPECAESTNPDLHATCAGGACRALDIREHPASACGSDDDCRLRVTGCCECGGSTESWALIAIARDGEAAYEALVCDDEQACDACVPIYPTDTEAYCAADGHCAARPASGDKSPFPCGNATPVIDSTTGLEQCSRGYQRRVGPANCPSLVPRAASIPNYNAALDDCERDSDCATATYGPYAHCGVRTGGFAHACVAGCVLDTDCDAGSVCLCGEPVGRCVAASCSTGADCGDSLDCASVSTAPGCFSTQFACQSPDDACGGDGDCAGTSPNAAFCVLDGAARTCSITQCTTP